MNVKYFFGAVFFVSSFYKVIFGYSFQKTFKSPKEKYDELVEEKDKYEILERSNFSVEEDENKEQKSKDNTPVDSCSRATATAQIHVRFGTEHKENKKNENIQNQFYEKRSLMFDPYIYQQFLYYMFLSGGHANFGTSNCGHYCNPHGRIPSCPNFHYCSCQSPNYMLPYDASHYYNPNTHFINSNLKRDCKTNNRNKKQLQSWDDIQNLPVKQLTKQELKLVLKYLDNEETEESKPCSEKLPIENNFQENSKKTTLGDSFAGPVAETPFPKKYQKRSISQNCKFPNYYKNTALKVTNNLEFVAVNISSYW